MSGEAGSDVGTGSGRVLPESLTDGVIRLRRAAAADLSFVLQAEEGAKAGGFVSGATEAEHRTALVDPVTLYWVIEAEGSVIGYAILRGLGGANRSIELQRIVLTKTDRGHGRRVLRLLADAVFGALAAHRFWLDVFEHNARARHLYTSEGFVNEGMLRECVRTSSGYASLVVMSLLEWEYEARRRDAERDQ